MMEQIIATLIGAISPSALPIVVLCLGGLYLYFKFGRMEKDRHETKAARDKDSQDIHDTLLSLKFKVSNLEGRTQLHDEILGDLNKQMNELNVNIASLAVKIDSLSQYLKDVSSK